jgi:hypothetical protein
MREKWYDRGFWPKLRRLWGRVFAAILLLVYACYMLFDFASQ